MKLLEQRHAAFYDAVCEAARHAGLRAEPYSGRGMYGRHCLSVTYGNPSELMALGWCLAKEGYDARHMPTTREDSMAMDVVVYWPDVEVVEEVTDLDADAEED